MLWILHTFCIVLLWIVTVACLTVCTRLFSFLAWLYYTDYTVHSLTLFESTRLCLTCCKYGAFQCMMSLVLYHTMSCCTVSNYIKLHCQCSFLPSTVSPFMLSTASPYWINMRHHVMCQRVRQSCQGFVTASLVVEVVLRAIVQGGWGFVTLRLGRWFW